MKSPREVHEKALSARTKAAEGLVARANAIATARLLVFIGAVVTVGAIAWVPLPPIAWVGEAALVFVFVVLVSVHARVHTEKERMQAAARFHERALARMAGKWRASPATGERFAAETHPYAGDLDVFGRASLFQLLDATATRFGEEVLARRLSGDDSATKSDEEYAADIRARQAAVRDLAPRVELREQLAVAGSLVDGEEKKPDPRPFVMWAAQSPKGGEDGASAPAPSDPQSTPQRAVPNGLLALAILVPPIAVALLVLDGLGLAPRFATAFTFGTCFILFASIRGRIEPILGPAASRESSLTSFAGMLALIEDATFESETLVGIQKRLRESGASATNEMRALSRIVGFLDARNNGVFRIFIGPVLMWELWCAIALDRWRHRAGRSAFGWFRALAELEALASLAGFAFERPDHVFPELIAEPVLDAEALGHPLIDGDKRVCNDVAVRGPGHGLVVTGSNMSGKSTLLRALGVNAVLANVGAPVCAKSMRMGRIVVATSMRVSDSLDEGTSRFYAELKKLKLVLDLARAADATRSDRPAGDRKPVRGTVLFLLDEILHGTNTRERLIGARAILRELLALGAMGAVSTHDLALGDLEAEMPGKVENVHFQEQVEGDVMTFDYQLRGGVVQSSNALRLMKMVGLDVVEVPRVEPAVDEPPAS